MVTSPNPRLALALAVALYLIWVTATYLLEGHLLTFQRPEDTLARLTYTLVANVLIGLGGSALAIRALSNSGIISPRLASFQGIGRALLATVIGALLGFAFYALQGAPTYNPLVILNAYAQVLVGSVAEVLVCWAVVGSVSESLLQGKGGGRWVPVVLAAIVASALFGVYHFAHSSPFNTVGVVVLLSVVGLVTSLFSSSLGTCTGRSHSTTFWASSV